MIQNSYKRLTVVNKYTHVNVWSQNAQSSVFIFQKTSHRYWRRGPNGYKAFTNVYLLCFIVIGGSIVIISVTRRWLFTENEACKKNIELVLFKNSQITNSYRQGQRKSLLLFPIRLMIRCHTVRKCSHYLLIKYIVCFLIICYLSVFNHFCFVISCRYHSEFVPTTKNCYIFMSISRRHTF